MKKIINILVLFFVSASILVPFGYADDDLDKYEFTGKADWNDDAHGKQYYFGGFDFEGYKPSIYGLSYKIQSEAYKLNKTWEEERQSNLWDNGNFYFLGYSQGGLRALATAAWLKANNPNLYDKLNSVITVSGINRGLKALEGGVGYLEAKLRRDYQVLYYGAYSAQRALDGLPLAVLFAGLLIPEFREEILYILAFYFGMYLVPSDLGVLLELFTLLNIMPELAYIALAFKGIEMPEINDMVPGSKFITDTLVNTDGKSKLTPLPDGYRMVQKVGWIRILGIPIFPYTYSVRETTYKLVTVYDGNEILRIDEEMPLGYIAGFKSDSFSLSSEAEIKRKAVKNIGESLHIAKIIHAVKMVFIYGYFIGSPVYYGDALSAENYVNNIDDKLNLLKGSPQNDGLVALENQYYPKSMHENVLLGGDQGYEDFPFNHKEMKEREDEIIEGKSVKGIISKMAKLAVDQRIRP